MAAVPPPFHQSQTIESGPLRVRRVAAGRGSWSPNKHLWPSSKLHCKSLSGGTMSICWPQDRIQTPRLSDAAARVPKCMTFPPTRASQSCAGVQSISDWEAAAS